ncbi:MAG: hypothetical protein LUQ18_09425 [Methylococcaceae bacterium]|nr:hypothetical protein [Methylococcaceae bacterium]
MRGGKREGAGRKGNGTTKVYRLPVELEPHIMELLNKYKNNALKSVTKSKDLVKPSLIQPTDEQIKRLQIWLETYNFAKSSTEARKITANRQSIKNTVLECKETTRNAALNKQLRENYYYWAIQDLINLYEKPPK